MVMTVCLNGSLARRHAATAPSRRAAPVTRALASLPPSQSGAEPERLLPLLSDYVAAKASVMRFERLAGRTAMIGAAVALATEVALPSSTGLFGEAAGNGAATQLAALLGVLLCCSAGLAARLQRPFSSRRLLEPVICSLTSQRRSFSGVTQSSAWVDRAVDAALDSVFTSPFILQNFVDWEKEL